MNKFLRLPLHLWIAFQSLLATGIVLSMIVLHRNAPGVGIVLSSQELGTLNPKAVDTMNALAVLMNGLVAIFLSTLLMTLRDAEGLTKQRFVTRIATPLLLLQALGFVSDAYFNNQNLHLNILSSAVLVVGLGLYARTLKRYKSA